MFEYSYQLEMDEEYPPAQLSKRNRIISVEDEDDSSLIKLVSACGHYFKANKEIISSLSSSLEAVLTVNPELESIILPHKFNLLGLNQLAILLAGDEAILIKNSVEEAEKQLESIGIELRKAKSIETRIETYAYVLCKNLARSAQTIMIKPQDQNRKRKRHPKISSLFSSGNTKDHEAQAATTSVATTMVVQNHYKIRDMPKEKNKRRINIYSGNGKVIRVARKKLCKLSPKFKQIFKNCSSIGNVLLHKKISDETLNDLELLINDGQVNITLDRFADCKSEFGSLGISLRTDNNDASEPILVISNKKSYTFLFKKNSSPDE